MALLLLRLTKIVLTAEDTAEQSSSVCVQEENEEEEGFGVSPSPMTSEIPQVSIT